ncbi:hypothetical protein [Natronomonas amylolytica]|uniref:hypothetical protein n=1 Tax=Natronomonas amylolytica TaxID=3108498 RepID=UPI0030088202
MTGVVFESLSSPPRIRIADAVGHEQTYIYIDEPSELTPTSASFPFRVTDAVEATLSGFEIRGRIHSFVRDSSGRMLFSTDHECEQSLPADDYYLELTTAMKLYVETSSSISIKADSERLQVSFDGPTRVTFGSRSPRNRPPETVTTTEDPEDLMTALSCLGEGILADSPDRSYPTIRGHPPEIAIGSELDVPDSIDPHDSDIVFELPPRVDALYPAVPLVYYLDAAIETGENPRLVADGETVYETTVEELSSAVKDLLPHVFMLDCLARQAGFYPFDIGAHEHVADDLPFDPADYYDRSTAEQLRAYLEVPFETLEPHLPQWSVTAHVEPAIEHVTAMPYLAAQLAFVDCVTYPRVSGDEARKASLKAFVDGDHPTRATTDVFDEEASFVDLSTDSRTRSDIWVGDDIPLRANKFLAEGYRNRHQREPLETTTITVTIVCNESWMDGEAAAVEELYGAREELPFEIRTHERLGREELADVLRRETDFFHYIGHAESRGLKCTDGFLDIETLPSVGADAFFLNACQSYQQAAAFVESGAIGGIATLSDVINEPAMTVGRTTARLLNQGFSLRDALFIARERSFTGGQYLTVGDDSATVTQPESPFPNRCIIDERVSGYSLYWIPYTNQYGLGSVATPHIESEGTRYLAGTLIGPYDLSRQELREFLELQDVPVEFEGEFYWASELADELQ